MTQITFCDTMRLSEADLRALVALLAIYGAHLVAALRNKIIVLVPSELAEAFQLTVERDILPVEVIGLTA